MVQADIQHTDGYWKATAHAQSEALKLCCEVLGLRCPRLCSCGHRSGQRDGVGSVMTSRPFGQRRFFVFRVVVYLVRLVRVFQDCGIGIRFGGLGFWAAGVSGLGFS